VECAAVSARPVVAYVLRAVAEPGVEGVRSTANIVARLPVPMWTQLLPLVFRAKPNRAGWQLALGTAWVKSSTAVVASTKGDSGLLVAYFDYADFANLRLPYLHSVINTTPRAGTLYRGGQGAADDLARGYSWTAHLDEAVRYAYDRPVRPGSPVILQRHVEPGEIALQLRGNAGGETVLLTHRYDGVVDLRATEVARLLDGWRKRCTRAVAWADGVRSASENVILEGWRPDA
jgi:hypothetical protein